MLEGLRNRFLKACSAFKRRSNSGEVVSKTKIESAQSPKMNRPLSIDSKQKQEYSKAKLQNTTKKFLPPEEINSFIDEASDHLKTQLKSKTDRFLNRFVSDIDSENKDVDQVSSCSDDSFLLTQNCEVASKKETILGVRTNWTSKLPLQFDSIETNICGDLDVAHSQRNQCQKKQMATNKHGKLVYIRPMRQVVRMLRRDCSICRQPLKVEDSLQLACTHRFHKGCAFRMIWNMSYKCDICEGKKRVMVPI